MRIGVPREVKDSERRIALLPAGVAELCAAGHTVRVERDAGAAVGFGDDVYRDAGALIVDAPDDVWQCELIVKVKELQPTEYGRLVAGTTICGFAQLGRDPSLLAAVLAARVRIIAFETIRDAQGSAPLLAPMSRIAGRLAPFAGAQALGTDRGGSGVLLPGVDDVPGANVVVIGAGSAGTEAALVACRLGCRVTLISRGAARLLAATSAIAATGASVTAHTAADLGAAGFAAALKDADLVIGAVLVAGRLSPKLITRAHLRSMRTGSALVDIGIDQGGIAETARMTTLSAPTYVEEGVVHYAVPNLPSLVARTATLALAAAAFPFVRRLADLGVVAALDADPALVAGVMAWEGTIADARLAADAGVEAHAAPWRRR
ncbi:MAG TPA: alanine dehydrogenase, partial [Casimicrobiaceae bacterium]|nr:alanine dehydrogenase [Casimicrobiaceae bacterium]